MLVFLYNRKKENIQKEQKKIKGLGIENVEILEIIFEKGCWVVKEFRRNFF